MPSELREKENNILDGVYHIPLNKAVTGEDIKKLVLSLDISYDESHWLFGVCVNTWTNMVTHGLKCIVTNPTLALLAKYYSHYPEKMPFPRSRSFAEIRKVAEGASIQLLGTCLGKEKVTAHRWNNAGTEATPFSPSVQRLANHFYDEAKSGNINWWEKLVDGEAKARGANSIWKTGNWNNAKIKNQYAESALVTKINSSIATLESECSAGGEFMDELGLEVLESEVDKIVRNNFKEIKKPAMQTIKDVKSKTISIREKVNLYIQLFKDFPLDN
jgi:hypothetical protein